MPSEPVTSLLPAPPSRIPRKSSVDPRAARTRQIILDAVSRLTAAGFREISVSDVVREAGVSRSSFYTHFANLDEVAVGMLDRDFWSSGPTIGTGTGASIAREAYTALAGHLTGHQVLFSSVLDLPLASRAYDEAIGAYADRIVEAIVARAVVPADISPDAAATYVAGGARTLISAWMRGSVPISDDELVEQLVALLPAWFAS